MTELPQYSSDQGARKRDLARISAERVRKGSEDLPPRHAVIPLGEQDLYLSTSRQIGLDNIRVWIHWMGISFKNYWFSVQKPIERHASALWLFPKPAISQFPIPDDLFAQQRFCGPQTSSLEQITSIPKWLIETTDFQEKLNGKTLYTIEYDFLCKFECKPGVHLPKIRGLFSCSADGKTFHTEVLCICERGFIHPKNLENACCEVAHPRILEVPTIQGGFYTSVQVPRDPRPLKSARFNVTTEMEDFI